jgi:eukaryotic-like serine/threonine-protein kinase
VARPPDRVTTGKHRIDSQDTLGAQLAEEMAERWRAGDKVRAEHFLDKHPTLWNQPAAVMDLVYEELCLCHEHGESVDAGEIVRRFPKWKQQLEILLDCLQALRIQGDLPCAGEAFGDFQLLSEIGHGGLGRVFVATQSSLGDRPVVLKITPCRGDEHLSLARLQHTHIVPLLSVIDEPERNLRVLCMPYFGGLTLAELLEQFGDRPPSQRTGRQFLDALNDAQAAAPIPLPLGRDPATPFLERASYIQAVCWVGACLAEALKYAHDRGLLHLDVKPSNVLLTANHQPMLLDFHLAHEPLRPGDPGTAFGGTPAYMSPEQKLAMAAIKEGGTIPQPIDGRADIYSLGLVLHEALSGALPEDVSRPPPLWRCNPQVSRGLADIIAKCLCDNATDRYAEAGALAADLWAHLNDLPLKGVANRCLAERWRKWRRRKPHLLHLIGMFAVVLAVTAAALVITFLAISHRVDEARVSLAEGQQLLKKGRHADAANTLQRGLSQLEGLPGNEDLRHEIQSRLQLASGAQLAQQLHEIADRFRLLYGSEAIPAAKLEVLRAQCREFWDKRDLILERLGTERKTAIQDRIHQDLLDLAILGADMRVRLAGKNGITTARQEALEVLAQAEALFGNSAVLYHERRVHAEALGLLEIAGEARHLAAECPPRKAWEHYAVGRSLLNSGQLEAAASHLGRAVALQPDGLWPNFYQGICCYRLGRYEDAALAFTASISLAPNIAGCHFNRALAFVALGRGDRALTDLDRALELDPGFAEADLQRKSLLSRKFSNPR